MFLFLSFLYLIVFIYSSVNFNHNLLKTLIAMITMITMTVLVG